MLNFLIFLAILVILFGLEATRAFIFGAFGFIFWAIVIFVGGVLILDMFTDKRTPEQKKKDERAKAEKAKQKTEDKHEFWNKTFPILAFMFLFLALIFLAATFMKK